MTMPKHEDLDNLRGMIKVMRRHWWFGAAATVACALMFAWCVYGTVMAAWNRDLWFCLFNAGAAGLNQNAVLLGLANLSSIGRALKRAVETERLGEEMLRELEDK